jgi:diguanylate cyclase (GGDEF)-like protein
MLSDLLKASRSSIQLKLFLSLTAIVALSLAAILMSQVYLVQDYFVRQAESNLRSSNYLLSRVLADPLFEHDLTLLQARLLDVKTKMQLCNFQLKDQAGDVVFKIGQVRLHSDTEFNPNSRDGCFHTIIPVVHESTLLGTLRLGVRTGDIAQARAALIRESAYFALFWFAVFMLPFFVQIRRLVSPLSSLSSAAQRIANGDLDHPIDLKAHGNDEISRLVTSFQGMAQALVRNRDSQAASLAALKNEKSTLDSLLTTIPVGVVFADRSHVRYCNDAFCDMCLRGEDMQVVGVKNDILLMRASRLAADADAFIGTVAAILQTRELSGPHSVALKDGRILQMTSNVVSASDAPGFLGRFWLFEDVTEERRLLHTAELRAEQDILTQLYNRQRFDKDLPRFIAQAERDGSQLALVVFDLDDFKPVNDLYGHAAGDTVLRKIAHTLSSQLRRNEVLYRVGGDEFALLLPNAGDEELAILAERIVSTVYSLEFDFDGTSAKVGCSLGIARYPHDATTLQSLVQLADQAMYDAKKRGKNTWLMHLRRD